MVCITFRVDGPGQSDVCLLAGVNPTFTILVDEDANTVSPYNGLDCPTAQGGAISCMPSCEVIPTLSAWGLIVLALLLLTGAKTVFRRSSPPV